MVEVLNGSNLTDAAIAVGFSDLAHFSHVYRRTFGANASRLRIRKEGFPKSDPVS
jgi:transcriptional regulator GlxA family with amidase domain